MINIGFVADFLEDYLNIAVTNWWVVVVGLVVYGIAVILSLTSYIFYSIGLCSMARRRGVRGAWMAWFPILNMWLLGSISDQYLYVVKGKEVTRRKTLLALNLWLIGLGIVLAVLAFLAGFSMGMGMPTHEGLIGIAIAAALVWLAMLILAIVMTVHQYIALYHLYYSATPDSGVALLVLSIFFNLVIPFAVFAVRKKENGMPPRREVA